MMKMIERLKSAAIRSTLLCLILGVVLTQTTLVAADDPILTVDVDHVEADTWASVMVRISVTPFIGENNSTYHVNRMVTVVLTDLDAPEVLVYNANVSLSSGIATYNFRIKPEWGEFLLAVDVYDPLTATEARQTVKVYFSTEYAIYLLTLEFDADVEAMEASDEESSAYQRNMTTLMALIVFVTFPIALLKLDHRAARHEGKSSFWDKIVDAHFNFTFVKPALWHYLEDDKYEFRASGRRGYREQQLLGAQANVRADMVALKKVDDALEFRLDEFEEPKGVARLAVATSIAAAVAKKTEEEMDEEVAIVREDREERLAAEEEYDVEEE